MLKIPFIESPQVIDGLPDKNLDSLDWQIFSHIEKSAEHNRDILVRYKIGYDYASLYVIIEANSDSIICRDRAYQNGDGLHLVIARPDSDGSSNEFYVLRFSPANRSRHIPARKGVWYYNIDLSGKSLSSATQWECQSSSGKSYFELRLPWSEVYPYHPFFSNSIGLNLCFVKAIGEKEKNFYYIRYDDRMQSELSDRKYAGTIFAPSNYIDQAYSVAAIQKNNLLTGNNIMMKFVSISPLLAFNHYMVSIRSADHDIYGEQSWNFEVTKGLYTREVTVETENLKPGDYKIFWHCSDNSEGDIPITVLPEINYEKEKMILDELKNRVPMGDYYSLLFTLQEIVKGYEKVKEYETAGDIREAYLTYCNHIAGLKKNANSFSIRKGVFRRAFLSQIDHTLQPYSIRVPENFERTRSYPLLVMLHGSGSDDRNMLNDGLLTEHDFIQIAPYGRGTSNCFTTDGAEIDVKEAIDDVIRYYPIDTSKIIIAGFSMGGYGAYRIFYEYPKQFKGIAVFSGHPNLASKWIGGGYPDFLNDKYLEFFKNIPVFIYHSKNDLNCPYSLTEELACKLKAAGAVVTLVTTDEGGHEILDKSKFSTYYQWLNDTINR